MKLSICTEWLLFHLWKSNPDTGKSCPGVIIPETIIYRWAQPYFWYFTSRDGSIIRKTKDRISVDYLYEIFTGDNNKIQESDAIISPQQDNQIIATYMTSQPIKSNNQESERIDFEHFKFVNFKQFLYQRDKMLSAILQKFIMPQKDKNQTIKVTWTPQFCLFYRKTNIHDINNQKVSLNERLITFDGKEHLSTQDSICSPTLQKDIEHLCINIIRHIQEVSGGNIQISRMVLFMKVDFHNKLQLLYCTDLKIREKYTLQANQLRNAMKNRSGSPIMNTVEFKQDNKVDHLQMNLQNNKEQFKHYNGKHCLYCKQIGELYDLSFQHIILSYEQQLMKNEDFILMNPINEDDWANRPNYATTLEKQGIDFKTPFLNEDQQTNQKDKQVPLFLEYVWGKLSQQQYDNLKNNTTWIQLTTKVCDMCYMNFTIVSAVPQTEILHKQKNGDKFKNVKTKIEIGNYWNKQDPTNSLENVDQQILMRFKNKLNLDIESQAQNTIKTNSEKYSCSVKSQHQKVDQNLSENQKNFIQFKNQQMTTQKNFFYNTQNNKNDFLGHLKQMENNQQLAKSNELVYIELQKKQVKNKKKPIQNKSKNIYKNKEKNAKLPKIFVSQREQLETQNTDTTQDDGPRRIDHDIMIQTIRDIKDKLKQY